MASSFRQNAYDLIFEPTGDQVVVHEKRSNGGCSYISEPLDTTPFPLFRLRNGCSLDAYADSKQSMQHSYHVEMNETIITEFSSLGRHTDVWLRVETKGEYEHILTLHDSLLFHCSIFVPHRQQLSQLPSGCCDDILKLVCAQNKGRSITFEGVQSSKLHVSLDVLFSKDVWQWMSFDRESITLKDVGLSDWQWETLQLRAFRDVYSNTSMPLSFLQSSRARHITLLSPIGNAQASAIAGRDRTLCIPKLMAGCDSSLILDHFLGMVDRVESFTGTRFTRLGKCGSPWTNPAFWDSMRANHRLKSLEVFLPQSDCSLALIMSIWDCLQANYTLQYITKPNKLSDAEQSFWDGNIEPLLESNRMMQCSHDRELPISRIVDMCYESQDNLTRAYRLLRACAHNLFPQLASQSSELR